MTTDHRSLNAVILPALERCLRDIASDQGCGVDELSFGLFRALEVYGIECIRAAEQLVASQNTSRSGVMRVGPVIEQLKSRKRANAK